MRHPTVLREQILALRLDRHNLARRLPAAGLLASAAAVCGIQNSPPGSALLSFHARVEDVTGAELDRALLADKSLVQVWSVRAAPLVVPVEDAAIFTHGLLPGSDQEVLHLIRGAGEHLGRAGLSATDLVAWAAAALEDVLDGHALTKDDLGVELSRRLAQHIPAEQHTLWFSADEWGYFGESLARFALNVVALHGAFCLVSHPGRAATLVRSDQWLGHAFVPPDVGEDGAAAELLRRYLRAYGPSSAACFAQWAGIAPSQAQRTWQAVERELIPLQLGRSRRWLLAADAPALAVATLPAGVRLLPPHDPYLAARDRALLLPDKAAQAQTWRAVGGPGVVLDGGEIVATWRAQKQGAGLQVTVAPLGALPVETYAAVEAEAHAIARLRGCNRALVTRQA